MSDPNLAPAARQSFVDELMTARRAVAAARRANDSEAEAAARTAVDRTKQALGERGAPWWTDGTPDFNRHMAANTPYAAWFARVAMAEKD
jgi:hypothetical protein